MSDIVAAVIDQYHPKILAAIKAALPANWTLRVAEAANLEARKAAVADADVIFVMAAPLPLELLEAAPKLRFVQKLGAGVDRIDIDYCRSRDIAVARLFAGNATPVAEHTLLLMLAAYRNLVHFDTAVREGGWDKENARGVNRHLRGQTIGLVGFGAIGRAVAELLQSFCVDIVYYDPIRAAIDVEETLNAKYLPLDDLLAASDIVSLHLPLLPQTTDIVGAAQLELMKPDAVLVNCARGGLVDENALAAALAKGTIAAAAIDAFAKEPPTDSPLLNAPNTTFSPHLAGATLNNFAGLMERAVTNASAVLAGEALPAGDVVVAAKIVANPKLRT